jgi:hypothetical protein
MGLPGADRRGFPGARLVARSGRATAAVGDANVGRLARLGSTGGVPGARPLPGTKTGRLDREGGSGVVSAALGVFWLARDSAIPTDARAPYVSTYGLTLLGVLFTCLVLRCALKQGVRFRSLMSWTPLRRMGKYSYCIYVVHLPISYYCIRGENLLRTWTGPRFNIALSLLTTAACVALSYGVALVSWNLLERRFLELKKYFPYRSNVNGVDSSSPKSLWLKCHSSKSGRKAGTAYLFPLDPCADKQPFLEAKQVGCPRFSQRNDFCHRRLRRHQRLGLTCENSLAGRIAVVNLIPHDPLRPSRNGHRAARCAR